MSKIFELSKSPSNSLQIIAEKLGYASIFAIVFTNLELACLCVHRELVEIHGTHEPNSRGSNIQHLPLLRHPQSLTYFLVSTFSG